MAKAKGTEIAERGAREQLEKECEEALAQAPDWESRKRVIEEYVCKLNSLSWSYMSTPVKLMAVLSFPFVVGLIILLVFLF